MKLRINHSLLYISLYGMFLNQLYSYIGANYVLMLGSSYGYQQMPVANHLTVGLNLIAFISVILLYLFELKKTYQAMTRPAFVNTAFLMISVVAWSFITIYDIGMAEFLYTTTPPSVYLTALGVCIGLDNDLYRVFLRHARMIGYASLLISLLSYGSFIADHSMGAILGNSAALIFYVQGFWLLCIVSMSQSHGSKKAIYAQLMIFGILAALFNSRSWIIQTVIWLFAFSYLNDGRKGFIRVLKFALLAALGIGIAYLIMTRYYPSILRLLIQKSAQDNRSQQYVDLFNQTGIVDFIFGRGMQFEYNSQLQNGAYQYIDNAYLLMLIRYGLAIGLTYPLVFLYPLIRALMKKIHSREAVPVLMWLLALGGLSVYCVTIIDIKSVALAAAAGRCLCLANTSPMTQSG